MGGKRILFVRLRSLGDTILMTPALAVAKHDPENTIGVVCEEPCHQALSGNPHVDQLFITSPKRQIVSRLQVIQKIRKFRADVAIDLHGGTTSAFLTRLSGAHQRVGSAKSRQAWLYNCRVPDSRSIWGRDPLHTVEDQLASLKFLGFPVEPIPPLRAPGRPEDEQFISALLADRKLEDGFVLIHPAAAFDTKQWQLDRFAQLSKRLIQDGLNLVATAGPGEEPILNQLGRLVGPGLLLVEPQSLGRFASLASHCGIFVGNDTGSTHIAAALKKPVVVVFGSSDSSVWYPWQTEFRLVKSDLPCIPCPGYYCLHYSEPKCMALIEVDEVYQATRDLIRSSNH
jgi:ADP-heptose:LPS heptosyltransferase